VRRRDRAPVGDLVIDLSTSGALVQANERVLTGEEVIVFFKLPGGGRWFQVEGVVARVVHGRRPGDQGRSFGVEFHGLTEEDERLLFEQLRGCVPPRALRPRRALVPTYPPRLIRVR
jgi:hypothetical protein